MEKHWPTEREFIIDIAQEDESWSAQMRRILINNKLGNFIRMSEEFFLEDDVDQELLARLENYMEHHPGTFRIGLQTVHEGYDQCSLPVENENDLFLLRTDADYLCSLEASIFDGAMLLNLLADVGDLHIWESEVALSKKARAIKAAVIVTEKRVLPYKDVYRRGESRHPDYVNIV